jgi:hypothetical protein
MYRISTINKKSVVEIIHFKKGKASIVISRTYRFGLIDTNEPFEFPTHYGTETGIDVLCYASPSDHALIDCCTEEIEYRNVSEIDKVAIDNSEFGLSVAAEEQGFVEFENEWWFFGPLRIETLEIPN